ncbi:MAG: hypothetical protein HY892_14885 [Deltaproteobacteria bacterium]|nr:hypothetical protein [Deltaproteobacteria bacterium]
MKFFSLLVLIGAVLALGIIGIFAAKLLLGLLPKSLVTVILAVAGFILVLAVIRLNSRQAVAAAEK